MLVFKKISYYERYFYLCRVKYWIFMKYVRSSTLISHANYSSNTRIYLTVENSFEGQSQRWSSRRAEEHHSVAFASSRTDYVRSTLSLRVLLLHRCTSFFFIFLRADHFSQASQEFQYWKTNVAALNLFLNK